MLAKRILVVDDQAAFRALLEKVLENAGYEVTLASNGSEAIDLLFCAIDHGFTEKAAKGHSSGSHFHLTYDLILLDYKMPEKNGLSVLKMIRQHDTKNEIPVIFLTESSNLNVVSQAKKLGVIGYFLKSQPNLENLIDTVEKALY